VPTTVNNNARFGPSAAAVEAVVAANPVNAILNYLYALLESDTQLAGSALGQSTLGKSKRAPRPRHTLDSAAQARSERQLVLKS
jgi:hypothetical protein